MWCLTWEYELGDLARHGKGKLLNSRQDATSASTSRELTPEYFLLKLKPLLMTPEQKTLTLATKIHKSILFFNAKLHISIVKNNIGRVLLLRTWR